MILNKEPVVVTGFGIVTAAGLSSLAIWEGLDHEEARSLDSFGLTDFQPVEYLSNRRMMKAITSAQANGLAAIEMARRDSGYREGDYESKRLGIYVGSPPSTPYDQSNYAAALEASVDHQGQPSVRLFGKLGMTARPMTLLEGLPNNVLCYGAIALDCQGANSNYTTAEISGQLALINALRRIQRGQIDAAIAGAYSSVTPFLKNAYDLCHATGGLEMPMAPLADGAIFIFLEREAEAQRSSKAKLLRVLGGATWTQGAGPHAAVSLESVERFGDSIKNYLRRLGRSLANVGLVFLSGTGIFGIDQFESKVVASLWLENKAPLIATTGYVLGNLMEASGLVELALSTNIYKSAALPNAIDARQLGFNLPQVDPDLVLRDRPLVLSFRTSLFGDASFILSETLQN